MGLFDTSVQHPIGLAVQNKDVRAYNRTGAALAAGDIVQFDMNQAESETTTVDEGTSTTVFANVIDPVATESGVGIGAGSFYAVALEAIADDAAGNFRIQGRCDAYVIAASGSVAVGSPLVCAASNNLDLVQAANEPYHAIALEAAATPTTRTLAEVLFDGIGNFGTFVS